MEPADARPKPCLSSHEAAAAPALSSFLAVVRLVERMRRREAGEPLLVLAK